MNDINIIKWDRESKHYLAYKKMLDIYWKNTLFENKIKNDVIIYYFILNNTCVGWLALTQEIISTFKEKSNTKLVNELQKQWFYNLTYLLIDSKLRWKWLGGKFMKIFLEQNNFPIWLTAREPRSNFYEKLGLNKKNKIIWDDIHYIFTNKK